MQMLQVTINIIAGECNIAINNFAREDSTKPERQMADVIEQHLSGILTESLSSYQKTMVK